MIRNVFEKYHLGCSVENAVEGKKPGRLHESLKNNMKALGLTVKKLKALVKEKYGVSVRELLILLYEKDKFTAVMKGGEFCDG